MSVKPRVEPKKVKIDGPGVSGKGVPASIPTEITIDPTQAGIGDLEVQVLVSKMMTFLIFRTNQSL